MIAMIEKSRLLLGRRSRSSRYDLFSNGLVLALIFVNLYDVVYHLVTEKVLSVHQISEAAIITAITGLAVFLLVRHHFELKEAGRQLSLVRAQFDEARQEAEATALELQRYRRENKSSFDELRQAMQSQFLRWHFSNEEQRAARLIIQGLSFREIAARLGKSEKTIRNQSLSIYEKSGMTGRNDLAAFFLLDILDIDE